MDVLLTFTGTHDPGDPNPGEVPARLGPVLSVVAEKEWGAVFLFCTPRMVERTQQTRERILQMCPACRVSVVDVPLKDPTNYKGIFNQLRKHFSKISEEHPSAHFWISISSGTPHMHAAWLLLTASGEIPATLIQVNPPEFVPEGKSCLKEIDFSRSEFPRVSIVNTERLGEESDRSDTDEILLAACREIGLAGNDKRFYEALRKAALLASYPDTHILLIGETGAGKEYFSKIIHRLSTRHQKEMVVVNCSSIPENLFESQLFGHKKGSFTGAMSDHKGKFQIADDGILFLDEVGELPMNVQAKLLRAIEQGEIEPLGETHPTRVNVQVVAATNRNVRKMVKDGKFREDLYQRFTANIEIPPLRERRTDIPKLAVHLLDQWNRRHGKARRLSAAAMRALTTHPWPGNVRELRKVIEQSAMLARKDQIAATDLTFDISGAVHPTDFPVPELGTGFNLNDFLDDLKQRIVEKALAQTDGVQARAGRLLGWSPQSMNQYLKAKSIHKT